MVDMFTADERSRIMGRIRSKNTKPEVAVRCALHRLGFRYRLHVKGLPGTPDIVLPRYRTVVQVRGCFWHSHTCKYARIPTTNTEYWSGKLQGNRERDAHNDAMTRALGWDVIVVWECECKSSEGSERIAASIAQKLRHNKTA